MERKIRRERTLDAFFIDIEKLEEFCSLLLQEFDNENDVRITIEFKLSKEDLKFDSVQDIKDNKIDFYKVRKFSISLFGKGKYVIIDNFGFSLLSSRYYIQSLSDSASWCVGVNETAYCYLRRHRVWYHFLHRAKIMLPSVIFACVGVWKAIESLTANSDIGLVVAPLVFFFYVLTIDYVPKGTIEICQRERPDMKTIATIVIASTGIIGILIAILT